MTALYPRERVEAVLRPLSLASAHRIILKPHLTAPVAAYPSKSRFCDGRTYAVLYCANDFATAFVEVVVRDRFMQRDRRVVPFGDIAARGWVELALAGDEPLKMVDLRESGCVILGAPTDAAHARNQAAGRALSRALIDGIWYQSRLTAGGCLAIFDRALKHLKPVKTGQLEDHPKLPDVLAAKRCDRVGLRSVGPPQTVRRSTERFGTDPAIGAGRPRDTGRSQPARWPSQAPAQGCKRP
jgi:RES domain